MARNPKPVELHKQQGTRVRTGKGNAGHGVSYSRIHTLPDPPSLLGVDGREIWFEFGNELIAAGVMQKLDLYPLRQLAFMWDRFMTAQRNNEPPLASEQNTMRMLFAEFGATPVSRRRVAPSGTEDKGNPFAGFRQPTAA